MVMKRSPPSGQSTLIEYLGGAGERLDGRIKGGGSGESATEPPINPEEFARTLARCHEIIKSCSGLGARGGLYELCKLILVKLYWEERLTLASIRRAEGLGIDASALVNALFGELKARMEGLFGPEEGIGLGSHAVKEVARLLERYRLGGARRDALGVGFEAFVRGIGGELGAFLTPREVVEFMVGLADPRVGEAVLDPACGAGYFLIWSLLHQLGKGGAVGGGGRVGECLWGIDIDPFLARLCRINLKLFGADGRIFRADSLDLIDDPVMEGHGAARSALREVLDGGGFDVILTNPPFGRRRGALVTDRRVLEKYENGRGRRAQAPEILFVELCIRLLRPGGRAAILVPDGILSNMGRDYVALRRYVLRECLVRAVVSLPAGTFKQYGTDVKTSVLLLQRKRSPEETQEYVFMAIARHIGYDTHAERYRKEPQNDLPTLLNKYREWSNRQGGAKPDP